MNRKDKKESSSKEPEKEKENEKESKKASQEDDQEPSDEEESKDKDSDKDGKDERSAFTKFFFDPNNNPRPEGWVGLVMSFATGYYLFNYKKPRKEVTMMDFIN